VAPQRDCTRTTTTRRSVFLSSATDKNCGAPYRSSAKESHPDSHPGSEERFKAVSARTRCSANPEKRKEYDEVRRLGP